MMNKILILVALLSTFLSARQISDKHSINRFDLVSRHNISNLKIDPLNSLTVGNGRFAFTVDITGLQSFPEFYSKGIPLATQAQWGWHSFPNPNNYRLTDVYKKYKVGNDSIPYVFQFINSSDDRKNNASKWLRENPHRLDLGSIGLEIFNKDSELISISNIMNPIQQLDLWKGEIKSSFEIEGVPVEVITYCHQEMDMISSRITSDLLLHGKIKIKISFHYGTHKQFGPAYDLQNSDKHVTEITNESDEGVTFRRQLDTTSYFAQFAWKEKAVLQKKDNHSYAILPSKKSRVFEVSAYFSQKSNSNNLPGFTETKKNNAIRWEQFWKSGGAVDFSICTDPRAYELERRIVLSQYLTKIQCGGSLPPQETGLTYNSWYGKFHLEMHWWHAVHFILWQRADLIEPQLDFYFDIFDKALQIAKIQGYKGVRWPKMVAPDGRESPSTIGPFLIWQQPHVIYFAELLYRYHHHDRSTLEKYKKLVFASADFMASYARMDSLNNKFVLGPALIPAQERFNPESTLNPAFELAYWYWGLKTAQTWRERLNLKKDAQWQNVIDNLAEIPIKDSLYLFTENATDSYINSHYLTDHPMVLGILGFLPETKKINREIMRSTLAEVYKRWDWKSVWGWDIPLAAMNATCLNQPDLAINLLLMNTQKNTFLMNGHNYQDENLTVYLPGNSALLTAIAMMCTYKNESNRNGFPADGTWNIKYENLQSMY